MSEHKSLTAALAAFQAELPHVGKDSLNPHFKSKYAALEDIVSVVLPALAKQGLAWVTRPTMDEGQFVLKYELRHQGGESIDGVYPLSGGNDQQRGSSLTYAKRYSLCAVTGVTPGGEDDDGNAAADAPKQAAPKPKKLDATAWQEWDEQLQACESKEETRGVWAAAQQSGLLAHIVPAGGTLAEAIQARAEAL